MSSNNNGGFAFPFATPNTGITHMECGMSLRDYIAVKALPYTLNLNYGNDWGKSGKDHAPRAAREAYKIADAMIEARVPSHA